MVEFEHTLFQLLLLVGLLNSKPPHSKYTPFIIAAGLILVFLPPVQPISIPWDLVLALTIPLLLWQNAQRMINTGWYGKWKGLLLWVGSALLFALMLSLTNALEFPSAILFGLIIASMAWRPGEPENSSSFISQIGPLTLVFLLLEVEPMVETPTHYLGGIFSGIFFGLVIAITAVIISQKARHKYLNWIAIGQIYVAYGIAYLANVSAVSASLASVIVFVVFGLTRGLWPHNKVQPTPFNTWAFFSIFLALFIFLGWQAHQPISFWLILEVLAGGGLGLIIAWVGRRLNLPSFIGKGSAWRVGFRTALLLFSALLLWPRNSFTESIWLIYAFSIAVVFMVLSRATLAYIFED